MHRSSWARRAALLAALASLTAALFAFTAATAFAVSTGYQTYLDGSAADVSPVTQPGLLLAGGATDQDDAMARFVAQAGHGDIVVLDAWGKDSYGPYIMGLGADSVETFVFNNRSGAFDPTLLDRVAHAEAIYVDGGNQWDYVHFWKDTPLEDAINAAARTKPVGGISAGLAILGQYVYTAEQGTTLWVDPAGKATFYGAGGAYFLRTTHAPEVCAKGAPLTLTGVQVYRLTKPGDSFDLGKWSGSGGATYGVSAVAGVMSSTLPGGSLY